MLKKAILRVFVLLLLVVPVGLASLSPLLQWREWPYIMAGFAGVWTLPAILFLLLARTGFATLLINLRTTKYHRFAGLALLVLVLVHIAGLWVTSPPDMIDALLLRSPAAFSYLGTLALWALILTVGMTAARALGLLKAGPWRVCHKALGLLVVLFGAAHALMIEGTMEPISKWLVCGVVVALAVVVIFFPRRALSLR